MHTRLDAIENNLYSTARIVADERELNIKTITEEERLSHQPLGLDDPAADNTCLTSDYVMPALPAVLVTKLPHVNPNPVPPVTSICVAVRRALERAAKTAYATAAQFPPSEPTLDVTNAHNANRPLSPDISTEELGTPIVAGPLLSLLVGRSPEPLNEFTEVDPFYTAFPFVFTLGRGLQQPGTIPKAAHRLADATRQRRRLLRPPHSLAL